MLSGSYKSVADELEAVENLFTCSAVYQRVLVGDKTEVVEHLGGVY